MNTYWGKNTDHFSMELDFYIFPVYMNVTDVSYIVEVCG